VIKKLSSVMIQLNSRKKKKKSITRTELLMEKYQSQKLLHAQYTSNIAPSVQITTDFCT